MSQFYTNVAISGNSILLRGVIDGQPFKERVPLKPYHFVRTKEVTDCVNLKGDHVARVDFDSVSDAKDFIQKYEGVENADIYGFKRYIYPFIRDNFPDMKYSYDQISVVFFDIETMSDTGFPDVDIADKEVTAVSFRKGDLRIILSTVDYTPPKGAVYIRCRDETDLLHKFLDVWLKLNPDIISGWNIEFFDIPYIVNRMIRVLGEHTAKQLSPWLQLHEYTSMSKFGAEQSSYKIVGITTVDLMQAYMKFTFKNQESFRLDHIAFVELGEKKLDYSEYGSLHELWVQNPQKYLDYNMHDSDLVYRIDQKTGLVNQIITLAYDAQVNYADAFTSVLLWEVIIDNHLYKQGIVTNTFTKKNHKSEPIMGAFVKDPIIGRHEWVAGLDLDSLYPHLMMQYNISPETMVRCYKNLRNEVTIEDIIDQKMMANPTIKSMIENQNLGYTPNGAFFRNDKRGFLAELMDIMYTERKRYKKLMIQAKKDLEVEKDPARKLELEALVTQYNNMQMAKKICLNSAYGALSNQYFAFYDIDLAEAITYAGQLAIKWISMDLNKFLNKLLNSGFNSDGNPTKASGLPIQKDYVAANDTDSCYLILSDLVNKFFRDQTDKKKIVDFLVKVCDDKINPFINESYDRMREYTNAYENKMSMKVESISDSGLWRAKKKYALNVWWDEGVEYSKAKVKIKGLSAVQSSTPMMCRDKIKEAIGVILSGTKQELFTMVDEFEVKFRQSTFADIARTAGVSDMGKYHDAQNIYAKGTPMHVRGALLYNHQIKEKGIDKLYQRIQSGDKIKYCYLKLPNPIRENIISAYDELPKELGLHKFLDYDQQFLTVFMDPINDISKLVGWDLDNRSNLDALFGF